MGPELLCHQIVQHLLFTAPIAHENVTVECCTLH